MKLWEKIMGFFNKVRRRLRRHDDEAAANAVSAGVNIPAGYPITTNTQPTKSETSPAANAVSAGVNSATHPRNNNMATETVPSVPGNIRNNPGYPIIHNAYQAKSGCWTNNDPRFEDGKQGVSQHPGPLVGFKPDGTPVYGQSGQPGFRGWDPVTGKAIIGFGKKA